MTRKTAREKSTESGIIRPSPEALRRYESIPLLHAAEGGSTEVPGRVVFDSWTQASAIPLRDVTDGHVRRLRLKAGKITLELLAERRSGHWDFFARAYKGRSVVHDYVLKAGRKKLLAHSGGYFHWSSSAVPRRVELVGYGERLTFGELAWR